MPDLSTLTGENLVQELLQANGGSLDGIADYLGGDVTDLIVDSGSDSNGWWWRFANGLQLVAMHEITVNINNGPSGGYYYRRINPNYPRSFASSPHVGYIPSESGFFPGNVGDPIIFHERGGVSDETSRLSLTFANGSQKSVEYRIYAIGNY